MQNVARDAHTARVNGFQLSYSECGKGEPVLFVHGSNVDERIWDQHAQLLDSQYRIVALTQRYFGLSAWPDHGREFSIGTHAADLAAFVRTLQTTPITLVGWSYGAAVCLAMATRHLQLVKRMFLYEPAIATCRTAACCRFSSPRHHHHRSPAKTCIGCKFQSASRWAPRVARSTTSQPRPPLDALPKPG